MMDCLEAQGLISEKLDRAEVDGALLESAKHHCRTCPDCAAFVRALLAVANAPTPQPPDGLHDRIMGAVHRESAAVALLSSQREVAVPSLASDETEPVVRTHTLGDALTRIKRGFSDPRNERSIIAWTVAASVVFMAAGIGATMGVRLILSPNAEPTYMAGSSAPVESGTSARDDAKSVTEGYGSTSTDTAALATPSTASVSFITAAGTVYRAGGPAAGVDPAGLKPAGVTRTSLDGTNPPTSRELLRLDDPARVYLVDDAGALLGFDRVTRTYEGRVFELKSGELPSFGMWPSLPMSVQRPRSADGSPIYRPLGPDSLGVTVYGVGGSATTGILVAPGTAGTDPAAGTPDWTWWTPVAQ